jgi:hypothetical protein
VTGNCTIRKTRPRILSWPTFRENIADGDNEHKGADAMKNKMVWTPRATAPMDLLGLSGRSACTRKDEPPTRTGDTMKHTSANDIVIRIKDEPSEQKPSATRKDLAMEAWNARWYREQAQRTREHWERFVAQRLAPKHDRLG